MDHQAVLGERQVGGKARRIFKAGKIEFPPPADININMMPFEFPSGALPPEAEPYRPLILDCARTTFGRNECGSVCYLTIHESFVPAGSTQRRPGLHTDAHLNLDFEDQSDSTLVAKGAAVCQTFGWGGGAARSSVVNCGGIFLASTVDDSTMVWDSVLSVPGVLGDCENLREALGDGEVVPANSLLWITDLTPHEALPMPAGGYRQFFRLVTSRVDVWYSEHSTENPCGTQPDCRVVDGNKFGVILK